MEELYYSALDIAAIISSKNVGCQEESAYIDLIWSGERDYLIPQYRISRKKFILDVRYWMNYLYEKPALDKEFPAVQRDIECSNSGIQVNSFMSDFSDLDLFFKNIRICALYMGQKNYVRVKLRTLLRQYGYKRRSQILVCHINRCIDFYHLRISLRGGIPCNIDEVGLDQMITFRVV